MNKTRSTRIPIEELVLSSNDTKMSVLAAKNILHSTQEEHDQCSRKLYRDLGLFRPFDSPTTPPTSQSARPFASIRCESVFRTKGEHPPFFYYQMHLGKQDDLICIDSESKRLVRISDNSHATAIETVGEVTSKIHHPGAIHLLSADGESVTLTDEDFNIKESLRIEIPNKKRSLRRIVPTQSGFALVTLGEKTVHFLDSSLQEVATGRLHTPINTLGIIGNGEGIMCLMHLYNPNFGEVVSITPERTSTILGGLTRPTTLRRYDKGLLICDLNGLHVVATEGLAIRKRYFAPWGPILQAAGIDYGYGYEALISGDSLYIVIALSIPTIPSSTAVSIARFKLFDRKE